MSADLAGGKDGLRLSSKSGRQTNAHLCFLDRQVNASSRPYASIYARNSEGGYVSGWQLDANLYAAMNVTSCATSNTAAVVTLMNQEKELMPGELKIF